MRSNTFEGTLLGESNCKSRRVAADDFIGNDIDAFRELTGEVADRFEVDSGELFIGDRGSGDNGRSPSALRDLPSDLPVDSPVPKTNN